MIDHLKIGLNSIQKKDSSPYRLAMWQSYKNNNFIANFTEIIYKINFLKSALLKLRILMSLCYIAKYNTINWNRSVWTIAHYTNEQNSLKNILQRLDISTENVFDLHYGPTNLKFFLCHFKIFIKVLKYSYKNLIQIKPDTLLVNLRQVDFMVFYFYWIELLSTQKTKLPKTVFASTESNPEIIAPLLALKYFNSTKLIYIDHGSLATKLGDFFYDTYICKNFDIQNKIKSHLQTTEAEFYIIGNTPKNLNQFSFKSEAIQSILIVGSIIINHEKLIKILTLYREHFSNIRISFRPHPNSLLNSPLLNTLLQEQNINILPSTESLLKQAQSYNMILVGNTSATEELLQKSHVVFKVDIDNAPFDIYGYVKNGLIANGNNPNNLDEEFNTTYLNSSYKNIYTEYCTTEDLNTLFKLKTKLANILNGI